MSNAGLSPSSSGSSLGSPPIRQSAPWPTVLLNFVVFQAAWFGCVTAAAKGKPMIGCLIIATALIYHLCRAQRWQEEAKLAAAAIVLGIVWDSLMASTGLLVYPASAVMASGFVPTLAPLWIIAMWALLATTLNVSMNWLAAKPWLAAVMGAIAGPLSFWAGERMGALQFGRPLATVITLSIGWAVMMPVLLALARRFDGVHNQSPGASPPPPVAA